MNKIFSKNDSDLKESFFALKTRRDVADFFEISEKHLIYYLYRLKPKYTEFFLTKRSGNKRKILSPNKDLKFLQSKLLYVLKLIFKPRDCVTGFSEGRNIITNSKIHLRCKYLLNIDLKDFFPSINFGRVRGLFLARPFNFETTVATVIAQICTFEDELPQGAPTSPIISNMICSRLDKELIKICKDTRSLFTRYADDITISSSRQFSNKLLVLSPDLPKGFSLGEELVSLIKRNGFKINEDKVSFSRKNRRLEVTGLVVNEKLNVKRKFQKEIRAMLYMWAKFGHDNAAKHYFEKYSKKNYLFAGEDFPSYANVLWGKINFFGMVRGRQDKLFRVYYNKFMSLTNKGKRLPIATFDYIKESIVVVETDDTQGTAFYLKEYGWVTNSHVVNSKKEIFLLYSDSFGEKYKANIKYDFPECDLAILTTDLECKFSLEPAFDFKLNLGQNVTVCGFPDHNKFDSPYVNSGKIVATRKKNGIDYFVFDKPIVAGNSGGPVLNLKDKIVGIASTGADTFEGSSKEAFYGIIPLQALKVLLDKNANSESSSM